MHKGYIKIKSKCKFEMENNILLFEREYYSPETGELANINKCIVDLSQLNIKKAEIEAELADINDFISDVEKEIEKI